MTDPAIHLFRLEAAPSDRLTLIRADGSRAEGLSAIRAFPITDPDHGVALVDAVGVEAAWIDDPAALDEASRSVLIAHLRRREFLPLITRIVSRSGNTEPCEWEVVTDRGPTRFVLKSEDDIRRLGPHRALIVDSQGIRYLVADSRELDRFGRRLIERYLY